MPGKKWSFFENGMPGLHLTINPQKPLPPEARVTQQFVNRGITLSDRERKSNSADAAKASARSRPYWIRSYRGSPPMRGSNSRTRSSMPCLTRARRRNCRAKPPAPRISFSRKPISSMLSFGLPHQLCCSRCQLEFPSLFTSISPREDGDDGGRPKSRLLNVSCGASGRTFRQARTWLAAAQGRQSKLVLLRLLAAQVVGVWSRGRAAPEDAPKPLREVVSRQRRRPRRSQPAVRLRGGGLGGRRGGGVVGNGARPIALTGSSAPRSTLMTNVSTPASWAASRRRQGRGWRRCCIPPETKRAIRLPIGRRERAGAAPAVALRSGQAEPGRRSGRVGQVGASSRDRTASRLDRYRAACRSRDPLRGHERIFPKEHARGIGP